MPISLNRTLTLPQMVLYGLGTTIGAGIYALIGELAGVSGYLAPVAFLLAALLAGMTALSFAELSGRFPQAAGAALYVKQGLHSDRLSLTVGLLVIMAGLVSASALVHGFSGYLAEFIELPTAVTILITVLVIGALAVWGIAQAVWIANIMTLLAVGGLLATIYLGLPSLQQWPTLGSHFLPSASFDSLFLIYSGVLLAFFAFIGFEDMVDVAEEIKNVKRTLPLAILFTLGITTLLYVSIMIIALLSFTPQELAQSTAPMSMLFSLHSNQPASIMNLISLFAIINGAIIQVIMASRVLYGLSCRALLPAPLSQVNPVTHTPILATLVATLTVLALALTGNLLSLAQITSLLMLTVFSLVNLSLWRIKQHQPAPYGNFSVPRWVPFTGFTISCALVVYELIQWIKG
jgi:amino acid transporter